MADVWVSQRSDVASLSQTTVRTRYNTAESPLPLQARITRSHVGETRFAHPAESAIASMLTSHRVAWEYEPTTFPLVTGSGGQAVQCFTPDFYLPEFQVYVEMTTMRQSLVTRKNKKFRLMRELYPDVNVKLLYRKDVELVVDQFRGAMRFNGLVDRSPAFTSLQIERRAGECARHLAQTGAPGYTLLAVQHGATAFRDLVIGEMNRLGLNVRAGDVIGPETDDARFVLDSLRRPIEGSSDIVLVADVVSTGLTLWSAIRTMEMCHPNRISIVTLVDRPGTRIVDAPLAFAAFTVPSDWYVGGGLGPDPALKNLPDIYKLLEMPVNLDRHQALETT